MTREQFNRCAELSAQIEEKEKNRRRVKEAIEHNDTKVHEGADRTYIKVPGPNGYLELEIDRESLVRGLQMINLQERAAIEKLEAEFESV